ncbi:MAG TPA: Rrf2 family transcriptional regulator [Methyloceanibacter sp.]|nr:Rrf2 family transcriptional regulator [Methyloceanibacter sp.]
MRLTVYSDYALRMLMYLAVKNDGLATIAEIAESYGISKTHLMKVAHELGVAGYVVTVRGRGGGLRLARPRETIKLGDVVRHTEPDMMLVPCFAPGDGDCAIERCCVLKKALARAGDAFLEVLDGYSLADLARPRSALRTLLAMPRPAPGRSARPAAS